VRPPSFMLQSSPEPKLVQRKFNGRQLQVWLGRVPINAVKGWPGNPRIDIEKRVYAESIGRAELSQDEILDLMKNTPSIKLKELSIDIQKNGLQMPLILTYDGCLLDGNRRFFAIRLALDSIDVADPARREIESAEAWVLAEETSENDRHHVLVETNFAPSLKIEWPDLVKADEVVKLHRQAFSEDQIARALSWTKAKVRETIRTREILDDFLLFAQQPATPSEDADPGLGLSEPEAIKLASDRYQFFNEAQKSFWNEIRTDYDFKLTFFKWIASEKFGAFAEVRIAHKAYKMPEAKAAIETGGLGAGKSAKAIVDYNERVIRTGSDADQRILSFVDFLKRLDAATIKSLAPEAVEALGNVTELVRKMSEAARS
jgi:hypothetical protein